MMSAITQSIVSQTMLILKSYLMIYIFGWSLAHVDWFSTNNGQTFMLMLQHMLQVEPVHWSLGGEWFSGGDVHRNAPGECSAHPHRVQGFTACGKKVAE